MTLQQVEGFITQLSKVICKAAAPESSAMKLFFYSIRSTQSLQLKRVVRLHVVCMGCVTHIFNAFIIKILIL